MNIYLELFCQFCILFVVLDWWRKWFRDRQVVRVIRHLHDEMYPDTSRYATRLIAAAMGVKLDEH